MDLFRSQLSSNDKIKTIKNKAKKIYNCTENSGKTNKSFKLIHGSKNTFNNCVLFIQPFVGLKGFMSTKIDKFVLDLCDNYHINNPIITYGVLTRSKQVGRNDIKKSIPIINDIIDLVNPKIIVSMGEVTSELFLSSKKTISDNNGTIITRYNDHIPVILTYEPQWYFSHDGYEDDRYKKGVQKINWNFIKGVLNDL